MKPLDVLLTCRSLSHRGGSEMYVRDLALGLVRRGTSVSVWSTEPGPLTNELVGGGVRVVERLTELAAPPDLVHGQQHLELAAALLRFPATPAVFTCHAARDDESEPLPWQAVRRSIAVDRATRDRLLDAGVPAATIETVPNAVDLTRFRPRPPLPATPRRALAFSNYLRQPHQITVLRAACSQVGLELEIIGSESGHPHAAPELALPFFDVVFAKARCALEALAVGCAVVLCDEPGAGPLVTRANVGELRRDNFGFRCLDRPFTVAALAAELARYDATDAGLVRDVVRREASLDDAVARLLDIYTEVVAEATDGAPWRAGVAPPASDYLLRWAPHWRRSAWWQAAAQQAAERAAQAEERAAAADLQAAAAELRTTAAEQRASAAEHHAAEAATFAAATERELRETRQTLTWRLRARLLRVPALPGLYRRLRRWSAARST